MTRESAVRTALTLAVLLPLATSIAAAQGTSELRGRVVSDSGVPIVGAAITLTGIGYSVRSDSLGRFHLAGTPGSTLELSFQATGFRDTKESVVLARRRPVVRDFVLVSEGTLIPETNPSDRALSGRITTSDGAPVGYANIQVNGGRRYLSDDSGRFVVPTTTTGRFSLLLRRIGFVAQELQLDAIPDTALRIHMIAIAMVLPEQRVTGGAAFASLSLGGFYRRMAEVENGARVGYFVTPEDLALRNPVNLTDAVEQFPNLRVRPSNAEQTESEIGLRNLMTPRNMRLEDRSGCILTVYLDGIRIQPSYRMKNGEPEDTQVNTLVNPGSVAGIEVYPRALGTPPQYPGVDQACGVVLIWTK